MQGRRKPSNVGYANYYRNPTFSGKKLGLFLKEKAKYWVCNCTPCTPTSTGRPPIKVGIDFAGEKDGNWKIIDISTKLWAALGIS